jgi:hypothetical protein
VGGTVSSLGGIFVTSTLTASENPVRLSRCQATDHRNQPTNRIFEAAGEKSIGLTGKPRYHLLDVYALFAVPRRLSQPGLAIEECILSTFTGSTHSEALLWSLGYPSLV